MRASIFALGLAALLASPASAALVNAGAWVDDTDTHLEWLNLNATTGIAYNDVLAGYGRYTTSFGWQVATVSQLETLGENYIGPATVQPNVGFSSDYFVAAQVVAGALGNNDPHPPVVVTQAFGFLAGEQDAGSIFAIGEGEDGAPYGEWAAAPWAEPTWQLFAQPQAGIGTFLVRSDTLTATPEISTMLMMLLGFGGLGYAGRRRELVSCPR
jgi:hypothetical protein